MGSFRSIYMCIFAFYLPVRIENLIIMYKYKQILSFPGDNMKQGRVFLISMGILLSLALTSIIPAAAAIEQDFTVVSTTPAEGAKDVPQMTEVVIKFSDAVNESTLTDSNIIIKNTGDGDIFQGDIVYDDTTFEVTISNLEHAHGGGQQYEDDDGPEGIHSGASIEVKLLNVLAADGRQLVGSSGNPGDNFILNFNVEKKDEKKEDSPGFGLISVLVAASLIGFVLYRKRK